MYGSNPSCSTAAPLPRCNSRYHRWLEFSARRPWRPWGAQCRPAPGSATVSCAMGSACCLSFDSAVTSHATMIWCAASTLAWALPQYSQPLLLVRMMCNSGSVKLVWALSSGVSSTGLGALPRRGSPGAGVPPPPRPAAGARPPRRLSPALPDVAWPPQSWPSGLHGAPTRRAVHRPAGCPARHRPQHLAVVACVTRASMSSRKRSASLRI